MSKKIVVIGGGAAGASAASRAKKLDPSAEVILIEATDMITHGPCAIPYYVEGIVKDRKMLVTYTPEDFERDRGIRVLTNTVAKNIDVDKKVVVLERDGKELVMEWDKLVIATGATPAKPRVNGVDLKNVYTIRHPAQADELSDAIRKANNIVIVGGSYLGLEMAEAALSLGKKTILIEKEGQLLPRSLDRDVADIVAKEVVTRGLELHLSEPLKEIIGKEFVEAVATSKNIYKTDLVILATGVKPNIELATKSGIKIGITGAVEVNEYMETNIEGVYAAGDVAEKRHIITGKKVWIPLAPSANKEGQVAGANAALGRSLRFPGIVGTAITKFFDMYIARTGLGEEEAKEQGFKIESKLIKVRTKAHYYPKGTYVYIKMVVDASTGRILGAQIVGWEESVAEYINSVAIAIEKEMTIEDLFFADIGYHPAVAPVWHPLIVAARTLSHGRF
ncbi:MAG: FAD-dependent oxidoreductase [Ignisphaera sp.]